MIEKVGLQFLFHVLNKVEAVLPSNNMKVFVEITGFDTSLIFDESLKCSNVDLTPYSHFLRTMVKEPNCVNEVHDFLIVRNRGKLVEDGVVIYDEGQTVYYLFFKRFMSVISFTQLYVELRSQDESYQVVLFDVIENEMKRETYEVEFFERTKWTLVSSSVLTSFLYQRSIISKLATTVIIDGKSYGVLVSTDHKFFVGLLDVEKKKVLVPTDDNLPFYLFENVMFVRKKREEDYYPLVGVKRDKIVVGFIDTRNKQLYVVEKQLKKEEVVIKTRVKGKPSLLFVSPFLVSTKDGNLVF